MSGSFDGNPLKQLVLILRGKLITPFMIDADDLLIVGDDPRLCRSLP